MDSRLTVVKCENSVRFLSFSAADTVNVKARLLNLMQIACETSVATLVQTVKVKHSLHRPGEVLKIARG